MGHFAHGNNSERSFTMSLFTMGLVESNVVMWLVSMFVLGLVSMGLCVLFLKACEKI
jgi:hypothetical protein